MKLAVPDHQEPLVGVGLHESIMHIESKAATSHKEASDSPNVPWRGKEDSGDETACESIDCKELVLKDVGPVRHKICKIC